MVGALVWILQFRSEAVLNSASKVMVKLISVLPYTMRQLYVLDIIHSLSYLLCFHQLEVAISCATALNMIFSSLRVKEEYEVWKMLEESNTVAHIVSNIRDSTSSIMSTEYFQEMAFLLSTILWRWPQSRYTVWNDANLLKLLADISVKPQDHTNIVVLKLYSALALCGHGAKKLLENGEPLLDLMANCMSSMHPLPVRVEGFKLAQHLVADEKRCMKIISMRSEPLIKAVVSGMSGWTSRSGKVVNEHMPLLEEACRTALITRWAGEHHNHFWKQRIDKVLLDLLLEKFQYQPSEGILSLEEEISIAQKALDANFLLALRPFVWDILGWLSIHCEEDFNLGMHTNDLHLNILIACACLIFSDSIRERHRICQSDLIISSRSESASRAVLMMIYSPCNYIQSKARFTLSLILNPNGEQYVKPLLHSLHRTSFGEYFGLSDILQVVISLVALACYSGLSHYQEFVIKSDGVEKLTSFLKWCLSNHVHIGRRKFAPHAQNIFDERYCCMACSKDWEGKEIFLLYGLWALAELIRFSYSVQNSLDFFSGKRKDMKAQLVSILQEIRDGNSAPGPRWYAAYILSYFGYYGFQNKIERRRGINLKEKECADMQLILASGDAFSVHRVVLAVQCPPLLPPEESPKKKSACGHSKTGEDSDRACGGIKKVRLSSHVNHQVLQKLLDFIYHGVLEAEDELVKKLKTMAKYCNLQSLLQMLCRKYPKWGAPIPTFDLALALGPVGHQFSDIILEAKATNQALRTCNICSLSVPHMHAHKVILWSSCDYLRALFQSGMQESHSQSLKIPICWEAMVKLLHWFYTDELPNPPFGCLWNSMETEGRLSELRPYIELYWLAEFWMLKEFQEACSRVIESCLHSAGELSIKVIQMAANLSLWHLAEVVADYMAPLYHKLRDSGDLAELDEALVDMVRVASVRFSQEGNSFST